MFLPNHSFYSHDIKALEDEKKKTLFDLIDTYIRDAKARKAYA